MAVGREGGGKSSCGWVLERSTRSWVRPSPPRPPWFGVIREATTDMANNPKKIVDPTEAALLAIQEALKVRDDDDLPDERAVGIQRPHMMTGTTARRFTSQHVFEPEEIAPPISGQRAYPANDDQQSIGQILRALQNRPPRTSYFAAAIFSGAWIVGCLALSWAYLGDVSAALGPNHSPMALMIGLGTAALLPIIFFFGVAHMAWRSQELRLIAQSMAQVAMRLAEPESVAREIDRHGRTGDPPRSRRHGRRRGAGAGAGERTRSDGAQRSGGARTHLQRQRGAHPRPVAGSRQPARHAGRPGRTGALRHQQRAHRSDAGFVDHQRSRRPAGQRGGRTHHPLARREGRAHHGGARADRRQYDPAAERARRRPDRAPGRRQRRDRACARDGQ